MTRQPKRFNREGKARNMSRIVVKLGNKTWNAYHSGQNRYVTSPLFCCDSPGTGEPGADIVLVEQVGRRVVAASVYGNT